MIAISQSVDASLRTGVRKNDDPTSWHEQFLMLLPTVRRHARVSFRHLRQEAREETVAEVIGHALHAFVRLWEQGRGDLAYAAPLARYGVSRVRDGRRVGGRRNVRDVMSVICQHRRGVRVERLDGFDELAGQWREIVVEEGKATPADVAAMRIDFASWLDTLPRRDRRVAERLAVGEKTGVVARMFRISAGRVAQLRKELYNRWCAFQGENVSGSVPTSAG